MSYSKRQKEYFFSQVNNVIEDVRGATESHDCYSKDNPVECLRDVDYPLEYGVIKWALRGLLGRAPTTEEIKQCRPSTTEQVRAYRQEYIESMNYQFGIDGW